MLPAAEADERVAEGVAGIQELMRAMGTILGDDLQLGPYFAAFQAKGRDQWCALRRRLVVISQPLLAESGRLPALSDLTSELAHLLAETIKSIPVIFYHGARCKE